MRYDENTKKLSISVGELITLAHRGIGAPTDDEYGKQRHESPKKEMVPLSKETDALGYTVTVFGYADGIEPGMLSIERTIDTYTTRVSKQDRERARGEGFILLYLLGMEETRLRILYRNADGDIINEESETPSRSVVEKFFKKCITVLEKYARPEIERVTERLPALRTLKFPYKKVREGQADFIRAVHRTIAHGTELCASLPTGTGKTVSVIYPALRALGEGKCDKIFYLTPKHTTAKAASECLELFASQGAPIRACILYSKEALCPEGLLCRRPNATCRLSSFKSIPDAVLSLYDMNKAVVTRADFDRVGREYGLCPHELALCYSELCDVVICDFNYLFDPQIYLKRYFTEGGRYAYLIDEAHNLPERAREMYSSTHPIMGFKVKKLWSPPYLQVALDLDNEVAMERIINDLPDNDRILLEAGTPLVKKFGVGIIGKIRALRPDAFIIADLKTLDVGRVEVKMAADETADAVAISGLGTIESIAKAIHETQKQGIYSILDMMNVKGFEEKLAQLPDDLKPDIVLLHRNVDMESYRAEHGEDVGDMTEWGNINDIKALLGDNGLAAVAGGIKPTNVEDAIKKGADIIIAGRYIIGSRDVRRAAQDFLEHFDPDPDNMRLAMDEDENIASIIEILKTELNEVKEEIKTLSDEITTEP